VPVEPRDIPLLAANASIEYGPGRRAGGEPRSYRNGLAEVPYEWRARSYPWAERALAAAEARHGAPGGPATDPLSVATRAANRRWRQRRAEGARANC